MQFAHKSSIWEVLEGDSLSFLHSVSARMAQRQGLALLEGFLDFLPGAQAGQQRAGAGQLGVLGNLLFPMCSVLMVSPPRQFQVNWISYMSTQVSQGFCTDRAGTAGGHNTVSSFMTQPCKYIKSLSTHSICQKRVFRTSPYSREGKLESTLLKGVAVSEQVLKPQGTQELNEQLNK